MKKSTLFFSAAILVAVLCITVGCTKEEPWAPRISFVGENEVELGSTNTFSVELDEPYMNDGSVEFFWEIDEEVYEGKSIEYVFNTVGTKEFQIRAIREVDGQIIPHTLRQQIKVVEGKASVYFISTANVGSTVKISKDFPIHSNSEVLTVTFTKELNELNFCAGEKDNQQVNYFENIELGNHNWNIIDEAGNKITNLSKFLGQNDCVVIDI